MAFPVRITSTGETTEAPKAVGVIEGGTFVVTTGANLGDGVSGAETLVAGDIYRLMAEPEHRCLALRTEGRHFRVAPGTEIGQSGATVCLDCALTFMGPDGCVTEVLVLVELGARATAADVFLVPMAPLAARTDYTLVGIETDGMAASFAQIGSVAFTRGTHITMSDGAQRRIETLEIGDLVLTRDAGPQQIRWIGQSTVRATGALAPVCIRAGTLHNARDLVVSPDHRLLIHQRRDRIGAGLSDILVKARHLVNGDSVSIMAGGFAEYFQLLFDQHHMIFAEGIAAESFLVDSRTAPGLPAHLPPGLAEAQRPFHSFPGWDVQERLLDRPDAVDLLRQSSTTG